MLPHPGLQFDRQSSIKCKHDFETAIHDVEKERCTVVVKRTWEIVSCVVTFSIASLIKAEPTSLGQETTLLCKQCN